MNWWSGMKHYWQGLWWEVGIVAYWASIGVTVIVALGLFVYVLTKTIIWMGA